MKIANIPLITYFASLILIAPLCIGVINIKALKLSPLKIIFYYCILFTLYEIVGWFFALNRWQNHFITNLTNYTDILFWGYYYILVIKSKISKNIIIGLMATSLLIILWSHWGRDFNRIDAFAHSVTNICLICIALIFFYQLLSNLEVTNLFNYAHFWIGVAALVYFSGVFFTYIFSEYIAFNKNQQIIQYWYIKEYLTFIHRVFIAIGFWYGKELIVQSNNKITSM